MRRWQTDPLLKVEHLTMRFGGLTAVDDVSFEVGRSDITALIGPNGAGKTTVFNCITGFYKPTEGTMQLDPSRRIELLSRAPRRPRHQRQGPRRPHLPEHQTVQGHDGAGKPDGGAAQALMPRLALPSCRILGVRGFNRLERSAVDLARHWLDRVGLTSRADVAAGELSYGEQRKLEIARAMCTRPLLLCLDEPAAGLNARESEGLNELLYSIRDEEGIALLLIEHDMSVVMRISDHVVVLDYGKMIADGTSRGDPQRSARHRCLSRRPGRGGPCRLQQ